MRLEAPRYEDISWEAPHQGGKTENFSCKRRHPEIPKSQLQPRERPLGTEPDERKGPSQEVKSGRCARTVSLRQWVVSFSLAVSPAESVEVVVSSVYIHRQTLICCSVSFGAENRTPKLRWPACSGPK